MSSITSTELIAGSIRARAAVHVKKPGRALRNGVRPQRGNHFGENEIWTPPISLRRSATAFSRSRRIPPLRRSASERPRVDLTRNMRT